MTAVFEGPQFRVQITHRTAWVENRESTGWVLRAQHAIPLSAESMADSGHLSTLRAALLDFETARAGDTSLRAALTGEPIHKRAPIQPRIQPPARFVSKASIRRNEHGWRTPLRPPLKPALNGA